MYIIVILSTIYSSKRRYLRSGLWDSTYRLSGINRLAHIIDYNYILTVSALNSTVYPWYPHMPRVDVTDRSLEIVYTSSRVLYLLYINFQYPDECSYCCCCLPTPMTLASGGSPIFPLVVHQPASPSIWPAVQSFRRGLSINPGVIKGCVCECS